MFFTRRHVAWLRTAPLTALILVIAGCGGNGDQADKPDNSNGDPPAAKSFTPSDLKEVGMAFHNYHDTHAKGPDSWEDLMAFAADSNEAIERVRAAGYDMKWGVSFRDATEGTSNFVLAESSQHPQKLYLDGSVR